MDFVAGNLTKTELAARLLTGMDLVACLKLLSR